MNGVEKQQRTMDDKMGETHWAHIQYMNQMKKEKLEMKWD